MDLRDGQSVELDVDAVGGVLGIGVHGSLVGAATQPLRECLAQAMRGGRPVVLELSEELLLEAHRRLATRLRLVVTRGGPVHQALRREGVSHVLSLHPTRAEAMAAAGPR